jgi:hypothetical protein
MSRLRDQDGVPEAWVSVMEVLRSRREGSFVMVRVSATHAEGQKTPANGDATLKILCLDCASSKLIATGGGPGAEPSASNFEQSHSRGPRHLRAAGSLAKYDSLMAAARAPDEPDSASNDSIDLEFR